MNELTTQGLLSGAIRRRMIRSVLIKDSKAFEHLYTQLQEALTAAWDDQMRDGIVAALDRLRDLGAGKFTAQDASVIMATLEERVGAEALQSALRKPVISLSDALFRTGAAEAGKAAGVDIAFMRPDLDALDALKNNNLFWIGEHWNRHTKNKLDAVLSEYFTEGMTREGLAQRMADDFRTVTSRSHVYWEMIADHMATKGREIGRVTGYQRAGIQRVQIRAHLDERTTPVCRHLHGRVIEVQTLVDQREAYFDALRSGNLEEMKHIWTMYGKGADLSGTATRDLKGVGSPPYHYRCRTITVAYWEVAGEAGAPDDAESPSPASRWKRAAYDREKLTRAELGEVIQSSKSATWATGDQGRHARGHFRKHAKVLGAADQDAYNQAAVDNIRRAGRDVYFGVKNGEFRVSFVRPHTRINSKGKEVAGYLVTVVAPDTNRLITYHFRKNMPVKPDEVPPIKQGGWGIVKWLFS
ncbi:MAG: hypothetical protein ACK5LJ_07065 [Paracoccus sp. (in: a-proteobacteria)]